MTDRPTPNAARLPEVVEAARPHARCLVPQDDTKGCPPAGPFPGLRAAVICSSVTGNTRRVAEALTLGRFPLYDVRQRPDTAAYDLLALGFWVRKGLPDARSQGFWEGLHGKRIFLFGTLGAWPHSPHASRCLEGARALLTANGNRIVGEFLCQGRVSPHVLAASARKGTHPMTEGRAARLAEAARHPDAGDIAAACACWRAVLAALAPQAVPPALPPLPCRTEHSLIMSASTKPLFPSPLPYGA